MRKMIMGRSRAHIVLAGISLLLASVPSGAAFSQIATGAPPQNAHAKPYGTGWQCDFGYREMNRGCTAIEVPANAHLVDVTFGRGWGCDRGYRAAGDACTKVEVPANAYLTDTPNNGRGWECNRGYRAANTNNA